MTYGRVFLDTWRAVGPPIYIANLIAGVFATIACGWIVGVVVFFGFIPVAAALPALKTWLASRDHVEGSDHVEGTLCCPDCGSFEFLEGPHGGASINVKCTGCGSTFNTILGARILERIGDSGMYFRRLGV